MDLQTVTRIIDQKIQTFDFRTLKNRQIDPFLLVTLVSPEGVMTAETVSRFVSEGNVVHHNQTPVMCLAQTLELTAKIVRKIPLFKRSDIQDTKAHVTGFVIQHGTYVILASVAGNWEDAEWITHTFRMKLDRL